MVDTKRGRKFKNKNLEFLKIETELQIWRQQSNKSFESK